MQKLKLIKESFNNSFYKKEYYVNEKSQLHGEYKVWYDNGQLSIHCYYKNNKLHGELKSWWDDGQLFKHCYFKNGKKHGEFKAWWDNGQLRKHCYFINGKKYSWKQYKKMKIRKILERVIE